MSATGLVSATTGANAIDVAGDLSFQEGAGANHRGMACHSVRVSAACTLVVRLSGQPADHKSSLLFYNAGDSMDLRIAKVWGTGDGTTNAISLDFGWE